MACKIIDSKTLSNHWVDRFIRQHPEPALESARAVNSTHGIIAVHFQRVQCQIRKLDILTKGIWNMDETGLAIGLCANGYVVPGKSNR